MTITETASAPANYRDLGGVRVAAGTVRDGLLFRSDDLATAPAGFVRTACERDGIGHVIDLRSGAEAARTGRGPFADPSVTGYSVGYHHLPLAVETDPRAWQESLPTTVEEVAGFYVRMTEESASTLALLLTLIASTDRPVVFHCAAGKDRTGVLAALVLTALGADPGAVADDYARTEHALPAMLRRLREGAGSVPGLTAEAAERMARSPLARAPRETMEVFLGLMADRHGGDPLGVLRAAGLDGSVVERLRTRLLTPE